MSSPHFAPYPDAQIRQKIQPQDWELYLDSWIALADFYLRLGDKDFATAASGSDDLTNFLLSFFHELVHDISPAPKVQALRKQCLLLLHRLFSIDETPQTLLTWTALADICYAFPKGDQFKALLSSVWRRNVGVIEKSLQTAKTSLT